MHRLVRKALKISLVVTSVVLIMGTILLLFHQKIKANHLTSSHISLQADKDIQEPISLTLVQHFYNHWKQTYVIDTNNGSKRVLRPQNYNDSVSQSIATGMLAAVSMHDKQTFNGLWAYAKQHMNNHGLMVWHVSAAGETLDAVSATDADQDMAYALIAADTTWGGYKNDAETLLGNIVAYEVEPNTYVLKPGDTWGGSDVMSPSYFSPAYYDIFTQYSGDSTWEQVKDTGYSILENIEHTTPAGETGLIPDWTTASGTEVSIYADKDYIFGYKSVNAVWRLALAAKWEKDKQATGELQNLSHFFELQGTNNIVDGYSVDGVEMGAQKQFSPFIDAAGIAAQYSTNSTYKKEMLNTISGAPIQTDYYADSYHLIMLLLLSNQFSQLKFS